MEEGTDLGPVPIAWWRFQLIGAMFVALYFGTRAVVTAHTHPAILGPAVVLGGAVGLLSGRHEAVSMRSPQRAGHRGRRTRRAVSKSAVRSFMAGLTGTGLILGQALSSSAMEWLMLGGVALMLGGAGHACVMARHYELAEVKLAR